MKRLSIFVIYSETGKIYDSVKLLIQDLKTVSTYFVVVVNGSLSSYEYLESVSDYIIVRENIGLDAGAYKQALNDKKVQEALSKVDELVFCNDTFWGPFVPFKKIFDKMKNKSCDFWGLSYSDAEIFDHIQSYFLVFSKKVFSQNLLKKFFDEIDVTKIDKNLACCLFEFRIFKFLTAKGFKSGSFFVTKHYFPSDEHLLFDKSIICKKIFNRKDARLHNTKQKTLNALKFISENFQYDIDVILAELKERYQVEIQRTEVDNHEIEVRKGKNCPCKTTKEELLDFVNKFSKVYLYGMGRLGQQIKIIIECSSRQESSIAGFIVSDLRAETNLPSSLPVCTFDSVSSEKDLPLVVCLGKKNSEEVRIKLKDFSNVFWLRY